MTYAINYISYGEDQKLKECSLEILDKFFGKAEYIIRPESSGIIFVASGGSEQYAKAIMEKQEAAILLCHNESNSYAATMEIAAYLRSKSKRVSIIDVFAPNAFALFSEIQSVHQAIANLKGQKAALIGKISDWLIVSDIDENNLKNKLGIELLRLPWETLEDYRKLEPSKTLMSYFPDEKPEKLNETARIYQLLENTINQHKLSAISVECFSMVMRDQVTACLPLAVLSNNNIVATCEGDLCSMAGQMIIRSLCNLVPWQANIAEIKEEKILFAHCTAPLNSLSGFEITTHFETNCGTAIQGKFKERRLAAFRINQNLNKYMLLEGEVTGIPRHDFACRTQIEFKTTKAQCELLKNKALGNHQLIFPATYIPLVERMMQELKVERVK